MNEESFTPPPELVAKLEIAAPTDGDFVLYCSDCGFVGPTNGALRATCCTHAKTQGLRIWRNRQPSAATLAKVEEHKRRDHDMIAVIMEAMAKAARPK